MLFTIEGNMQLELEQNEVEAIINVLSDLPTRSNAWPLQQKIIYQYEQQKPKEGPQGSDELPVAAGANGPAGPA